MQPKTSSRNPTWSFHSSGNNRMYCAEIGVPNNRVSGVFLSTEPGYSCGRTICLVNLLAILWVFLKSVCVY